MYKLICNILAEAARLWRASTAMAHRKQFPRWHVCYEVSVRSTVQHKIGSLIPEH